LSLSLEYDLSLEYVLGLIEFTCGSTDDLTFGHSEVKCDSPQTVHKGKSENETFLKTADTCSTSIICWYNVSDPHISSKLPYGLETTNCLIVIGSMSINFSNCTFNVQSNLLLNVWNLFTIFLNGFDGSYWSPAISDLSCCLVFSVLYFWKNNVCNASRVKGGCANGSEDHHSLEDNDRQ
jgi:hypothetical protein